MSRAASRRKDKLVKLKDAGETMKVEFVEELASPKAEILLEPVLPEPVLPEPVLPEPLSRPELVPESQAQPAPVPLTVVPPSDCPPTGAPLTEARSQSELRNLSRDARSFYRQNLITTLRELILSIKSCLAWLWSLKAPVVVLGSIALCPKMVLLWILVVIAKPICDRAYRYLPPLWKLRLNSALPTRIRDSSFVRDLNEGAEQGLPFILFWLYLCCAPFALTWMAVRWVKGFLPQKSPARTTDHGESFVFLQNPRSDQLNAEANFYSSRAFAIVVFAFFALGIPAFISYGVFENLKLEQTLQSAMTPVKHRWYFGPPPIVVPKVGLVNRPKPAMLIDVPSQTEAHVLTGDHAAPEFGYGGYWPWLQRFGVTPSMASVFFVHFYLVSLSFAMCVLLFRAWFQFPLEFLTDEHELEFTADGVKRNSLRGWFLSAITLNRAAIGSGPDSLRWSEVKSLRRLEDGFTKLYPLPDTAFRKESLTYKLLNKVAALIDGLSSRLGNNDKYLVFSATAAGSDCGRNIKFNLSGLSKEQRAKLFYAVKKWAPHVAIQESAEEQLVGSKVLRDPRYTQLWFDMLTSKNKTRRTNTLHRGEGLKSGTYTIEERISSGGQSTTYLATRTAGGKCVLKEFILSTSADSSALVESARDFEAEVSLLSQLDHPGIVRLQDFFFESGRVYVVLEHVPGQSLRQRVQKDGPLSEAEVVRIARSVCGVLEYLHGCNPPIVHCDVTPENILIQETGEIKVIDFSLAVKQDGSQTTDSCAKQCFTPPEQFREQVCPQSDLYALGATMFYLLTGVVPKPISSSSPKTKAPQVSDKLNEIVERATKLDLNQRFESAYWLKLDLDSLAGETGFSDNECSERTGADVHDL